MLNEIEYEIIASGSNGNCISLLNDKILIDMGVAYSKVKERLKNTKYILITHRHSDHMKKNTIKKINKNFPRITFIVGHYLYEELKDYGIRNINLFKVKYNSKYALGSRVHLITHKLYHNVENMGYTLKIDNLKVFYATDTYTLEHIVAHNYDYYFVERNYCKETLKQAIKDARKKRKFIHGFESANNHLAKQDLDLWLSKNNKEKGEVIYLHESKNYL